MAGVRAWVMFASLAVAHAPPALAEAPTLQAAIGDPQDFEISGSVRVRHELLHGQPRVGLRARDEQLALRSTLLARYAAGAFEAVGELYDSRAYLTRPGSAVTANEVNALELVQAYIGADLRETLGIGSSTRMQFGRMMLNLGSRRLVAADDYRNTTNSYTGIRADMTAGDGTAATLIYTLPQIRLPNDLPSIRRHQIRWDRESFDLRLWGGIVARPRTLAGATAELSYFRLQEYDSPALPTRNRNLHTVGARIIRDPQPGRWDFEAEYLHQFGSLRADLAPDAARLAVDAWFLHLDAGYSFPGPARLRLSVEYDHASGDGPGRRFGRFDTLFGMRRADLAPSGIYAAIGRTNIRMAGIRAEAAPGKRFDAIATYHAMYLADRTDSFSTTGVRDPSGNSGSFAAHQFYTRLRYWLIPDFLRAEVNAIWLAKGRFLKQAPNAPATGDTRYLSSAAIFTF